MGAVVMNYLLKDNGSWDRFVVITDLDGCLLDPVTYDYGEALNKIYMLQKMDIPIVFCSTKTRVEQEYFRNRLGIKDPFIVENGAAIFIPINYFKNIKIDYHKVHEYYQVIEYGLPTKEIIGRISDLISNYKEVVRLLHRMRIEEIMAITGLPREQAGLARIRDYSLVFYPLDHYRANEFIERIKSRGLRVITGGGILYTITGNHDKGLATRKILELYKMKYGDIVSIGIGDSIIDVPMLKEVDIPVILGNNIDPGKYNLMRNKNLVIIKEKGPIGWSKAINFILG